LLHPIGALASFTGPVVSVLDGDTIKVLHYTQPERIRLSGFDCPEKGQAYGNRAKQAASALVFGKDVILQTHGQDKYGRTLADVLLKDGTNVNHELVKAAGADGIGSMRRETQYSKGWRRMYERSR
jgi:endonuclease YncB( thermonuclease family)